MCREPGSQRRPTPVTRRSGSALALSLAGSQTQQRCSGPGLARDGSPGLDVSRTSCLSHQALCRPGACVRRDEGQPQALWSTPRLLTPYSGRTSICPEASPQSPGSEWNKRGQRKPATPSRLPASTRAPNPQDSHTRHHAESRVQGLTSRRVPGQTFKTTLHQFVTVTFSALLRRGFKMASLHR